jgi:hypothetical protein
MIARIMIFDPYGGHGVALQALVSFFLMALGGVLGAVYVVRRARTRRRSGRDG